MYPLCRGGSVRRADLGGTRSARGDIQLFLTSGGEPVDALTLPADRLVERVGKDRIVVRDYGDHRGLARVLEAAGIAQTVSHTAAGGCPVVVMRLAACLLGRLPVVQPRERTAKR